MAQLKCDVTSGCNLHRSSYMELSTEQTPAPRCQRCSRVGGKRVGGTSGRSQKRRRRMWRTRSHTADNYGLWQTTSVMSAFQPSARRWTSWKSPTEFRVRRQGGPMPPPWPPPPPLRLDTVELKGSPSHQPAGHRFKTRLTCCGVLDQDRPPSGRP